MLSFMPPFEMLDHNLWYPSLSSPGYNTQSPGMANSRNGQQHRSSHPNRPPRTILSILRADEQAIELRKQNIRRFGAGWLKPPGVSKTLQGMWDEKAEREEQEANSQRELEALEATQTRMLEEQARAGDPDTAMLGDSESGMEERDLDDEIPDADEGQEWIDEDGDDALPTGEGDGDFGEGVELNAGVQTRDLDDDVPEAGSYQHTDTDVEDMSSDVERGAAASDFLPPVMGRVTDAGRTSYASIFGGGSSSPVVYSQRNVRRSGGLGRRHGREN